MDTTATVRATPFGAVSVPSSVRSDRSRRSQPWLARGAGALLASAVVHAAVAATIGGVMGSARGSVHVQDAVNVDVDFDVENAPAGSPSPQAVPGTVEPTHAHRVRPRRLTSRPRQPEMSAPPDDDVTPARFALSAGTVATGSLPSPPSSATGTGAASAELNAVGEGEVDERARLLAATPLVYPPAARQAEIELDLPVEIVVDATGRVVSARVVSRAGYGLDEAALRAIRGYQFSPASRAGRPVPVRMRWTLQFRLR